MATKILSCGRCVRQLSHLSPYCKTLGPNNLLKRKYNYCSYRKADSYGLNRPMSTSIDDSLHTENKELRLDLSDKCVEQLQKITAGEKDNETFLRVLVEGGGCSGFQYIFKLDQNKDDEDRVFEKQGVKVVVDEASLEILSGSTIDYREELIRSAFRVTDNPKAEMGCSCGVSFSLKI